MPISLNPITARDPHEPHRAATPLTGIPTLLIGFILVALVAARSA